MRSSSASRSASRTLPLRSYTEGPELFLRAYVCLTLSHSSSSFRARTSMSYVIVPSGLESSLYQCRRRRWHHQCRRMRKRLLSHFASKIPAFVKELESRIVRRESTSEETTPSHYLVRFRLRESGIGFELACLRFDGFTCKIHSVTAGWEAIGLSSYHSTVFHNTTNTAFSDQ